MQAHTYKCSLQDHALWGSRFKWLLGIPQPTSKCWLQCWLPAQVSVAHLGNMRCWLKYSSSDTHWGNLGGAPISTLSSLSGKIRLESKGALFTLWSPAEGQFAPAVENKVYHTAPGAFKEACCREGWTSRQDEDHRLDWKI